MGTQNFTYGDDEIGMIKMDSSFGVLLAPTATDCFRAKNMAMADVRTRLLVTDRRQTRSQMERIEGRSHATWAATVLFRPSGTAGTAPDFSNLLKLAFGTVTVNAGVSVVYSLLQDMTGLSASIFRSMLNLVEFVTGAICQHCRIIWRGNDIVQIEFSGTARAFGQTGKDTANGAGSNTTSLVVGQAYNYDKYSIIKIGTNTSGGVGFLISTAPTIATNTLTLPTPQTWTTGVSIAPFIPTPTFTGNPVFGARGTFSLDGGSTNVKHISGEVDISTGLDLLNEEALVSATAGDNLLATDIIMKSRRTVSVKADFIVEQSLAYLMNQFKAKVAKNMRVVLGDTAGSKMQIDMTNVEFDTAGRTVPETGEARVSLTGTALGTSGEDEISLTLT